MMPPLVDMSISAAGARPAAKTKTPAAAAAAAAHEDDQSGSVCSSCCCSARSAHPSYQSLDRGASSPVETVSRSLGSCCSAIELRPQIKDLTGICLPFWLPFRCHVRGSDQRLAAIYIIRNAGFKPFRHRRQRNHPYRIRRAISPLARNGHTACVR